ncbi:hypothetical protein [Microbulbifer sp. SAOS-129_SWC]|uniref:hypothetical protein n=1 Tax=Microbulbifer sp. SAOS-129_SWC TaxID=3145235 RepID=UPI0032167BF4
MGTITDGVFGFLDKGLDLYAQKEFGSAGGQVATTTAPNTGAVANGSPARIADVNATVSPVSGPDPQVQGGGASENVVIAGLTFNRSLLTLSVVAFIAWAVLKGAKGG